MKFFKRSITYIIRQPIKASIFFVLIVVLGTLSSGAIAIDGAINSTNQSLRRQMPAVLSIRPYFDEEEFREFRERFHYYREIYRRTGVFTEIEPLPESPSLTLELLTEVANFEQVQFYDFYLRFDTGMTAKNLTYWPRLVVPGMTWIQYDPDLGTFISIHGAGTTAFLNVLSDFLQLVDGRTFTEDELTHLTDVSPAIISSGFAAVNGLYVGSFFDGQVAFFENHFERCGLSREKDESPVFEESFYFEVIGIVEHTTFSELENIGPEDFWHDESLSEMEVQRTIVEQRIFIPFIFAERISDSYLRGMQIQDESFVFIESDNILVINVFILNDPLDFEAFEQRVEALEGDWEVQDFSHAFSDFTVAMGHLQGISNFILVIAVGATIVLTGLLVLLFLYERKHEIGIYLALGEKKVKIAMQLVLELLPLTFIGLTIALFIGNALSDGLAREMLSQELSNPRETDRIELRHELADMGYRFVLSHDEMLATYETSMTFESVLIFYTVGLTTVFIATIIPVIKIVSISPKKVLM